jgi:hypothetical protein
LYLILPLAVGTIAIALCVTVFGIFNHKYWGAVVFLVALPCAVLLFKKLETGAYDVSEIFWSMYTARFLALVMLWLRFLMVSAIGIFV